MLGILKSLVILFYGISIIAMIVVIIKADKKEDKTMGLISLVLATATFISLLV